MASRQGLAKFTVPHQHGVMMRPRLIELLDASQGSTGLWIEGAPGAGKTTLAASHVSASGRPCIWVRLDSADNDLAELVLSLSSAAAQTAGVKGRLPAFPADHGPKALVFARRYLRALYEQMPSRSCLVFDGMHELDADMPLEAIRIALDEAPADAQVLLLSRTAPPPAFAALEAARKLERLDARALDFTYDELQSLLPKHDALAVSSIHELTQGWAAGIVLAARCWDARRELGAAGIADIQADAKEAIFRFFAHEVMRTMPAHEQRILHLVSLLPEVSVAQAEALTGENEAARILERLYRLNLFTTFRRGSPNTYGFHALFREYLLGQAHMHISADTLAAARRQAAQLLMTAGDAPHALELLIGAGEWSDASRAIVDVASRLLEEGCHATLRRWIASLPDEALARDAWLWYWMGRAQGCEDEMAACAWYERGHARFAQLEGGALGRVRCAAAAIVAIQNAEVTFKDLAVWGMRLADAVSGLAEPLSPADDLAVAVAAAAASGAGATALPEVTTLATIERLLSAWELAPSSADLGLLSAGGLLLGYSLGHGSEALFDRVRNMVESRFRSARFSPLERSRWLLISSTCYLQMASRPDAERWLAWARDALLEARALIEQGRLATLEFELLIVESFFANAQNDQTRRADLIIRAGDVVDVRRPVAYSEYCYQLCALHLRRGEVAPALRAAEAGREAAQQAAAPANRRLSLYLIHGSALVAADRECDAVALFDGLLGELTGDNADMAHVFVALTRAWFGRDDLASFPGLLRSAMREAARIGFANVFNNVPVAKAWLCAQALARDIEPEFVRAVIQLRRVVAPVDAGDSWPWRIRVRVLGPFELEVDGKAVTFGSKTPRRQVELLQAIALSGSAGLSTWQATDWLWPDGESGKNPLDVTLHRLRKLLGDANAIQIHDGLIAFDRSTVWSDVAQFDAVATQLLAADLAALGDAQLQEQSARVLAVYRGPLLAGGPQSAWLLGAREQFHARFEQVVQALAAQIERRALWGAALDLYARALEHDNLAEAFYRGQIRCHLALAQPAEALNAFRRCRHLLSVVLGVAPAPQTLALVGGLRGASELRESA